MASSGIRFHSVTTKLKRAKFRQAFAESQSCNRPLVVILQQRQQQALEDIESGASVKSSAANGHMATFSDPGEASATPQEFVELWEDLLQRTEQATRFLAICATYGLDAWTTADTQLPRPLPAAVNPAVIVDATGEWNLLCLQHGIDPAAVVGAALDQPAIFLWVLEHLQEVREGLSNFEFARLTPGPQYI